MKLNLKSEAAAGIVAGAAFIASAGHIVHVVNETNPIGFALVYPIGIDGLIFVGIRALQSKRIYAGMLALLIGAFYSLAFNAHAEGALVMPRILIASSMPIAMFAAFLIEATGEKTEEIAPPVTVPSETEWDRMKERVETRLRAEHALEIERIKADFTEKFELLQTKPEPVKVEATISKPKPTAAITSGTRTAKWDVEKAIVLIADGRTNEEIAETVGTNAKAIQRTRRAVRLLTEDASRTDAQIGMDATLSAAHIARVRIALKG